MPRKAYLKAYFAANRAMFGERRRIGERGNRLTERVVHASEPKTTDPVLSHDQYRAQVDTIADDSLRNWIAKQIDKGHQLQKRVVVALRDGGTCRICWEPVSRKRLTLEHIVPRSHGGSNSLSNLRLTHDTCNRERGTKDCPRCLQRPCETDAG